jgi:hypothetical protein
VVVRLVEWTVGGCVAIYIWLWNVAGHEIISLTPTSLTIRRDILGFGRSKEYDLPSVRNLRIDPWPENTNLTSRTQLLVGGTIAFDYGAKTFRFGGGVDEAEASHLIELLKSAIHSTPPLNDSARAFTASLRPIDQLTPRP